MDSGTTQHHPGYYFYFYNYEIQQTTTFTSTISTKQRNIAVAIASISMAVLNYAWQWTHPVTAIQLLVNMQQSSSSLDNIGANHKPTLIDFMENILIKNVPSHGCLMYLILVLLSVVCLFVFVLFVCCFSQSKRCENCKSMALTMYQVEESYRGQFFVMVNGDDPNNWRLIEMLGVDAIQNLALIEADGTVDTALIGPELRNG